MVKQQGETPLELAQNLQEIDHNIVDFLSEVFNIHNMYICA